jgi:hypothetical protein
MRRRNPRVVPSARPSRVDVLERSASRFAAQLLSTMIIVIGVALGRGQLMATGAGLVVLGTLLLLDLNGAFDRLVVVAVRVRDGWKRGAR